MSIVNCIKSLPGGVPKFTEGYGSSPPPLKGGLPVVYSSNGRTLFNASNYWTNENRSVAAQISQSSSKSAFFNIYALRDTTVDIYYGTSASGLTKITSASLKEGYYYQFNFKNNYYTTQKYYGCVSVTGRFSSDGSDSQTHIPLKSYMLYVNSTSSKKFYFNVVEQEET